MLKPLVNHNSPLTLKTVTISYINMINIINNINRLMKNTGNTQQGTQTSTRQNKRTTAKTLIS